MRLMPLGISGLSQKGVLRLLVAGAVIAIVITIVAQARPAPLFHLGRDLELRATVSTYLKTGILLVKPEHTGSW